MPARICRGCASVSNRDWVRATLALVRRESPAHFTRLRALLRTAPALCRIGPDAFAIVADAARIITRARPPAGGAIEIAVTPREIVRLVDGTTTLERSLVAGTVAVRANAEALLTLAGAARVFADVAAHSVALQRHFEAYRAWVEGTPDR